MTHSGNRWYDKDPALANALESLREASDGYQAQVALNLIKIIMEHKIEDEGHCSVEEFVNAIDTCKLRSENTHYRRWYDMNATLSSAMQLLQDTPSDIQRQVIPSITAMIEAGLARQYEV